MMRSLQPSRLAALAALLVAIPGGAHPQASPDPDAGWETYLEVKQLSPDFATHPETARMSDPNTRWTAWPRAPELPADLRRRVFVNESYVLLQVDPMGMAAGCRPLRASAQPRLDAASCDLLMRPGFFSAYLLPPDPPRSPEQWVVGIRWQGVDPASARRNAAAPKPLISPTPLPPPPPPKKP
jgi:hypothetical protein